MNNNFKFYYYKLSKYILDLIEKAKMTEHSFMVIIALIIGIFSGFSAIAIRAMIKGFSFVSFPGTQNILENIKATPWFKILFIPAIGGLIVGPIIYFFAKEAKGHGVPEVMQAIIKQGGIIRPRVAIIKALASSITIGTGGSVGREGPIVQIGASLGSSIGQFFRVSSTRLKTFVACGAASGIAAAFNAPVAGALFAVEIILGDFGLTQFSPIVISSVMATVISHQFEGNFAAFEVPKYQLKTPYELIFYFMLAFICATVAFLFIKVLYFFEDFFENKVKIPEYFQPAIGGLIIGLMALILPDIMGVGYDSINAALHGNMIWYFSFILIFFKIIATSITLGSGGSGGIFAPSLFLGAMTGVTFGNLIHYFFPYISATPGAYALVAMGGLVAGATHAPITAIIIVFELTNDYHIILPLMIVCIISTLVTQKLSRESIYTLKLVQRNIFIKDGTDINIMSSIYVNDVYTKNISKIPFYTTFDEVINKLIASHDSYIVVVDKKGAYTGIISMQDIKDNLFDKDVLQSLLIASDIVNKNIPTVNPTHNCQYVLDLLSKHDIEGLPVIDDKSKKILGIIWRKNILDAYNKEIEKRDITTRFANNIIMPQIDQSVHFLEGYAITEIPAPEMFIGKSIKNLQIRSKYGFEILLIRSNTPHGVKIKAIPSPDYIISINDSLVIAGEIGNINRIKSRI